MDFTPEPFSSEHFPRGNAGRSQNFGIVIIRESVMELKVFKVPIGNLAKQLKRTTGILSQVSCYLFLE